MQFLKTQIICLKTDNVLQSTFTNIAGLKQLIKNKKNIVIARTTEHNTQLFLLPSDYEHKKDHQTEFKPTKPLELIKPTELIQTYYLTTLYSAIVN